MRTLEQFLDDPTRLSRQEALSWTRQVDPGYLAELLDHVHPDVRIAAATVLGLLGSEDAVKALLQCYEHYRHHEALAALLECGVEGRLALVNLCFTPGTEGENAIEAVVQGLARPPYRGVLLGRMRQLVGFPNTPVEVKDTAARSLLFSCWLSAGEEFKAQPQFADYARCLEEMLYPPLFPEPCTAEQELPGSYFARLHTLIDRQIAQSGADCRVLESRWFDELEARDGFELEDKPATPKCGRNDPCPCGSGKKYKKCCLDKVQSESRLDPWVQAEARWPWTPVALKALPTELPCASRVLEIISEQKPSRLRVHPSDGAVEAWVVAQRLLELKDDQHAVSALRQALLERDTEALEIGALLTHLVVSQGRSKLKGFSELLAELLLRHGQECHFQLAGEMFCSDPDEVFSRLDALMRARVPLSKLLAFADGVLSEIEFPELAEELAELVPLYAPDEPQLEELLVELREMAALEGEEFLPFPDPAPELLGLLSVVQFANAYRVPELTPTAEILGKLLLWPDCFDQASPDSQNFIEAELACRRSYQAQFARQLLEQAQQLQQLSLLTTPCVPTLYLAPNQVVWMIPAAFEVEEACRSAAGAGVLAAELGWPLPQVQSWRGQAALTWSQLGHDDLYTLACAAAHEWQRHLVGPIYLPLGIDLQPTAPEWPGDHPLLERARHSRCHVLEQAAEGAYSGRFHPLQVAAAPLRPRPPSSPAPEQPTASPLPSLELETDPLPVRKALRRVLRRLLRKHKVGEAHTALELVSRGVRGHLRGAVTACVELLLQRGVLRTKPTLTGLHTSIEPRWLPQVERFIADGSPPLAELAELLLSH